MINSMTRKDSPERTFLFFLRFAFSLSLIFSFPEEFPRLLSLLLKKHRIVLFVMIIKLYISFKTWIGGSNCIKFKRKQSKCSQREARVCRVLVQYFSETMT